LYLVRVSDKWAVVRGVRNSVVIGVVVASITDAVVVGVFLQPPS